MKQAYCCCCSEGRSINRIKTKVEICEAIVIFCYGLAEVAGELA